MKKRLMSLGKRASRASLIAKNTPKRPSVGKISGKRLSEGAQIEALKAAVLARHREWKKPRKNHYSFYLVITILILGGLYVAADRNFELSPAAAQATLAVTLLLAAAFVMLLWYQMGAHSQTNLESMIEDEINRFNLERHARK
ncbi:MAG: hypothetical protein V1835_05930 [Candidatus Micrarchaeota archaeon]